MIKLKLPIPTIKIKGKHQKLSLNIYRNAHYIILNNAKRSYKDLVGNLLMPHRRKRHNKIKITYTIYFATQHRRDLSNFLSVVDKFVADSLVDYKIIPDDSFQYLPEVVYRYGGIGDDYISVLIEDVV